MVNDTQQHDREIAGAIAEAPRSLPNELPHDASKRKLLARVREGIRFVRDMRLVAASGLFHHDWYLQQNPDVAKTGVNPLRHYLRRGAIEGRDPNFFFDSDWYLSQNPDVAKTGVNPLVHYLQRGATEGRDPSPFFNSARYLQQNPDVAEAGSNPLAHYLRKSASHGVDPTFSKATSGTEQQSKGVATEGELSSRMPQAPDFASEWIGVEPRSLSAATDFWGDYATMTNQISAIRQSRMKRLSLKRPNMICISDSDLLETAQSLVFPLITKPEVSIIVTVYENLKLTLECLTSILRYSTDVPYEIILVDDGSSEGTSHILSRIKNIVYIRNEMNVGYVRSCNHGAKSAKGSYVLFLNNDVQVTEDWLRPLVEAVRDHDDVGAAGPKMLFPDGRLQEAGAVVNRNGTSTMIGLFDDPELPKFNYVREVMYSSGACLLVGAAVFKELGGFDLAFLPAYCEDCDLSFRLRRRGLRLIYNPKSIVIHHLSATANSVDRAFKMRSVVCNQQKLSERWQTEIDKLNSVRLIAFYLPQYYPIPENDRWWGKGFTEWINVAKARPNYVGHYQPRLPADLGFYDLRVDEVMNQQAELARRYGIHGFCYFYYWFASKRLLELPLERMLRTNRPDFPFCIAWANENWTRRWDGLDHEVLIAQQHSEADDRAVIRDMMRYLRHHNYIRINGKPLLIVYRPSLLPDIIRTTELWRTLCRQEGLGEIYLALVESFENVRSLKDPKISGFDAAIEFPPHGMPSPIAFPGRMLNPEFGGVVHDYRQVVLKYLSLRIPAHVRFRSVMPSWDNTPRRQNAPVIFENASPGAYQAWLEAIIEYTHEQRFGDERIVFLNAWNEWGEGNYLEPDRRNGHAYLEATRNALDWWLKRPDSRPV